MSRLSRAAAALVVMLSLVGLVGQAVRGNGVVNEQRSRHTVANATIDDRYYDCLSTQAHSLVSSSTPVRYRPGATLWEAVLLNKSAGLPPSRSSLSASWDSSPRWRWPVGAS